MSASGEPDEPRERPVEGDPPWWTGGEPQPFLPSRGRRRLVLVLIAVALALFVAWFVYVGASAVSMGGMSM